jgi:hypothetical protein
MENNPKRNIYYTFCHIFFLVVFFIDNPTRKFLTNRIAAFFKFGPIKLIYSDNPTRKFLTNRIAAFFKFGPIKLIYSEKTPSRVKKQPAE